MKLSDFRPAFTTTKLGSTRTTSAVMTSPARISFRDRLSSNIAAKLFSEVAASGVRVSVVIKRGLDSQKNPLLETGLVNEPVNGGKKTHPGACSCRQFAGLIQLDGARRCTDSNHWTILATAPSIESPVVSITCASALFSRG